MVGRQQKSSSPPLLFQFWGEECVVYNVLSGDTHLLPTPHGEILQLITQDVRGDKLVDHLITECAVHHREAAELSRSLVENYKKLGLIDPLWN